MSIFTTKKESSSNCHQVSIIDKAFYAMQDYYYNIYYWFSDKIMICQNLSKYRKIVCNINEFDNLSILKMMHFQLHLLQERIIINTLSSISEYRINNNVELYEKTERLSYLINNFIKDNFFDRFGGNDIKMECDILKVGDSDFDFIDKTSDEQNEINNMIQRNIEENYKKEWDELILLFNDVMLNLIKNR